MNAACAFVLLTPAEGGLGNRNHKGVCDNSDHRFRKKSILQTLPHRWHWIAGLRLSSTHLIFQIPETSCTRRLIMHGLLPPVFASCQLLSTPSHCLLLAFQILHQPMTNIKKPLPKLVITYRKHIVWIQIMQIKGICSLGFCTTFLFLSCKSINQHSRSIITALLLLTVMPPWLLRT